MKYLNKITGKTKRYDRGDRVLYVGKYKGTIISKTDVLLDKGDTVCSFESQNHKFKRLKNNKKCKEFTDKFTSEIKCGYDTSLKCEECKFNIIKGTKNPENNKTEINKSKAFYE